MNHTVSMKLVRQRGKNDALGHIKLIIRCSDTFLRKLMREGGFSFFLFFLKYIQEGGWDPGEGLRVCQCDTCLMA